MNIGIVGPTNIEKFLSVNNIQESDYKYFLEQIGELLALSNHKIIITPSHISAPGFVAEVYKDFKGKQVIGIVPEDDSEFGLIDLEPSFADIIVNCKNWRNQPETFCEEADILLCIGLSTGGMIEICYSKWFKVNQVIILKDFLSSKLNPEIEKDLNVEYVMFSDLKEKLK